MIHIEVQGRANAAAFNRRMYRYHYRLQDRYPNQPIVSYAILTQQLNSAGLGHYVKSLWGCGVHFEFPVINLQDWWASRAELEASRNPFTVVILAQLIAHNTRDNRERKDLKFRLIRSLYERGYDKQAILELFRLIDWMVQLPEGLEQQLLQEYFAYEEAQKMAYVTSVERFGIEKGLQQGLLQGLQQGRQEGRRKAGHNCRAVAFD